MLGATEMLTAALEPGVGYVSIAGEIVIPGDAVMVTVPEPQKTVFTATGIYIVPFTTVMLTAVG